MKNRWLGDYCDLEVNGNVLTKTFNKNFPKWVMSKEWLFNYKEFRKINPTTVEIYEVEENKIHMEYIDGITGIEYLYQKGTHDRRLAEMSSCIFKLCSDMLDYSLNGDTLFYHEDLNLTNFVYGDDRIVLVDPESFRFFNTVNYNAFLQPHLNLSKIAHKIHDKTIADTNLW